MQCPKCKIEAIITKSENVIRDGKLFRRMTFTCRNKQCSNHNMEVGTQEVELPVVNE